MQDIEVEGGCIKAVRPTSTASKAAVAGGGTTCNLRGSMVLPTFVDLHTHIGILPPPLLLCQQDINMHFLHFSMSSLLEESWSTSVKGGETTCKLWGSMLPIFVVLHTHIGTLPPPLPATFGCTPYKLYS